MVFLKPLVYFMRLHFCLHVIYVSSLHKSINRVQVSSDISQETQSVRAMVHLFTLWSSPSHQVTLASLHGFCIIWHVDWGRVPVVVCTWTLIQPILCILLSTENRFIQNFRYFPYVPDDYFVHLEGQELYIVEPTALVKRSLWRVLSKGVTWLDVNFWTLAQVYQVKFIEKDWWQEGQMKEYGMLSRSEILKYCKRSAMIK